jgi:hypothetical protein
MNKGVNMQDHTEVIIQSLMQDIEQLKEHLQMQQMMIFQIIEALAAAEIISIEEPEEEPSKDSDSKLILP